MADPLFGKTWRMDSAKSSFSAEFSPSDETRVYEEIDGGYSLTVSGTKGGESYSWGYTALYDGQPHPVVGRDDVDSIVSYRINDRITVGFFKQALSPGGPYARTVSEDLQTLTVETAGRDANGAPFYDVIEYYL